MNWWADLLHHADQLLEGIGEIFSFVVSVLTFLFTAIGVLVLTITVLKAFVSYWRNVPNTQIQHKMARGMQMSLQFLLAGEILRTVITEQWEGILVVGAIIVLRIVLAVTIHWEDKELHPMRSGSKAEKAEQAAQKAS